MKMNNNMKEISLNEMEKATGGDGYFVWLPDGKYEYWFICSYCGGYEEYMASGTFGERLGIHSEGTFVCPKCGWHRDYVLDL